MSANTTVAKNGENEEMVATIRKYKPNLKPRSAPGDGQLCSTSMARERVQEMIAATENRTRIRGSATSQRRLTGTIFIVRQGGRRTKRQRQNARRYANRARRTNQTA